MDLNKKVAEKLKRLREKRGLSQREVAAAMFRTKQAYSNLENGKRKIEVDDLALLANFHQKSLMYFLSDFE